MKTYSAYKPSNIQELGDIPKHWEVKKLKYVAFLKSGESINSESIKEYGDYPVYGGNGLRGFSNGYTHEGNYVLIGRQGALCGNINYATGKFWASEHAVVATIRNQENFEWLGELLRAMNLNQFSISAAQPGLAVERIKELMIPIPPINEQNSIAKFLDTKIQKLIYLFQIDKN
jgi:type I restriction enzyme S subunit